MLRSLFFKDYELNFARETLGRTVTETDIVLHAGQTGDFYPPHMDAEWVKTQPFGQRIAHGTLVFSLVVGLAAGEVNPEAFTYGYEKLRFISLSVCLDCETSLEASRGRRNPNGLAPARVRRGEQKNG